MYFDDAKTEKPSTTARNVTILNTLLDSLSRFVALLPIQKKCIFPENKHT